MTTAIPTIPPVQLALRFVLEIGALYAIGACAAHRAPDGWRVPAALVAAALVALLWVTFAVRGDPSRSGGAPIPVPGGVRLALEWCVFGGGLAALVARGHAGFAVGYAVALLLHHAMTWSRIAWLVRQ